MKTLFFEDVGCASLPESALARLAPLRCEPGVQVAVDAGLGARPGATGRRRAQAMPRVLGHHGTP